MRSSEERRGEKAYEGVKYNAWRGEILFFFSSRRRHTRLQGDWSSDVCSSDLVRSSSVSAGIGRPCSSSSRTANRQARSECEIEPSSSFRRSSQPEPASWSPSKIGRASCRERG